MNNSKIGMNKTGIQMSPIDSEKMLKFSKEILPDVPGDKTNAMAACQEFINESEELGSIPLPGTIKGILSTTKEKIVGNNIETLIDKLGERAAFERTGVRLYEALINKFSVAYNTSSKMITVLSQFKDEELKHYGIVVSAIEKLGGDPTVQTPCADATGVASLGLLSVISDPRTTISQCLNAMLTVELTDNAGWELLIKLSESIGENELAQNFKTALAEEQEHLETIKKWLEERVINSSS